MELFAYVRVKRYESYGNWIWQNLVGEERQKIKLKSIHRNWRLSLGLLTPHAQYFILLWRWKLNNQSFFVVFLWKRNFLCAEDSCSCALVARGAEIESNSVESYLCFLFSFISFGVRGLERNVSHFTIAVMKNSIFALIWHWRRSIACQEMDRVLERSMSLTMKSF